MVVSITGIFGNFLTSRGDFAREFPVALFNTDKCKTLHFGYANARTEYLFGDEVVKWLELIRKKRTCDYHSPDTEV